MYSNAFNVSKMVNYLIYLKAAFNFRNNLMLYDAFILTIKYDVGIE